MGRLPGLVDASAERTTVISRNGHVLTERYPELGALSQAVPYALLLDGEIAAFDEDGKPDFAALWFRSRGASDRAVCFMAFDLLRIGTEVFIDRPYLERRERLESLNLDGPSWCTPDTHVGGGEALFAATREMGLEGIVAKRIDSRYRPGLRSRAWIKTKHVQRRTFALLGWIPPEEWRGNRGCVVLGLKAGPGVVLAGVVGSGYGQELVEQLPRLSRAVYRALRSPGATWDRAASLVGEVKFLKWSPAGGLRHSTIVRVFSAGSRRRRRERASLPIDAGLVQD